MGNSREDEIRNFKLKPVEKKTTNERPSMFDEIRKVKLKKADKTPRSESIVSNREKISDNDSEQIQSSLAEAIEQRRIQLTKFYDDNSDSDSGWSD